MEMQALIIRYLNHLIAERNASGYTVRNYRTDLNSFYRFLQDREVSSPDEVDRGLVRDYLGHLAEQNIGRASIARRLSAVRSFFRYLNREGIMEANPLDKVTAPKLERRLPAFLTVDETVRLLTAPDTTTPQGQRDRALLELLYASGLRVSEITQLDIPRVDLDNRELRVRGKGDKERIVLMGIPAARAVEAYLGQGRPELQGNRQGSVLFLSKSGKQLDSRDVQRILTKYAKQVGISQRVYPHLLRHTFATHMLDGGADLRVVQALLGHADLSSTQIYTHVSKQQAKRVYLAAHPMLRKRRHNEQHDKK